MQRAPPLRKDPSILLNGVLLNGRYLIEGELGRGGRLGEERSYLWVVTKGSLQLYTARAG